MSNSLDVLATMDQAHIALRIDARAEQAEDLAKARDLVAELVDEAKDLENSVHMLGMTCGRFSEVLARIRGEK